MSEPEIIYSDDEDDIVERIYFLCDISEEKDEITPTVDLDELLRTSEQDSDITIPEYEIKTQESFIKHEKIGEKAIDLLKLAIDQKIPQRYIFYDSDDNLVNLKDFLHSKGSVEGIEYILRNYFRISVSDFLLIYYISNMDMNKSLLINNLNDLQNITDQIFDQQRLMEYAREVDIVIEENLKMMKKKLEKLKKFFVKINELPYSNKPEDIERTIELRETETEFFIRDGDYQFDIDSGPIIFDNMKTISGIPLIVYISYDNNYYKISEDTNDIIDVLDQNYIMEDKEPNHIYLFVRIQYQDGVKIEVVDIDLELSKMKLSYPGNTISQIKSNIKKVIPNIVYVHENKLSVSGDFEIDFIDFNQLKFRYLCLTDDVFSNFLYLKEVANPRSLTKNVKYYFKTYEESSSFSDHSVSFHLNKIHSNRFLLDFKSKIIKEGSINEFILVFSKLISYYKTYNFGETFVDVIETRYSGPEGVGLGGEKHTREENYLKINSKKLDVLTKQAPGMFPTSLYGKSCPCNRQPIIVDDKDVDDWEQYLPPDGSKVNRNVVLFPPEESKQKSKKFNFVCPENKYPYLYFLKNPSFGESYPILPCCGTTKNDEYIGDYDLIRKDEVEYMAKKNERRVRQTKLKTVKVLSPGQPGILPDILVDFFKDIDKKGNFVRRGVFQNNTSSFIHCVLTASSHLDDYQKKIDPANTTMMERINNIKNIRNGYMEQNIKDKEAIVNGLRKKINSFVNIESCSQETFNHETRQVQSFIQETERVFNSELYYRLLEHMFLLNIFVFIYIDGEIFLEKPAHNLYHIREFNEYYPTLFVFKNISSKTIPSYELIEYEDNSSLYLRDVKFLSHMRKYINAKNYSLGISRKGSFSVLKNAYNGFDWYKILRDYKILSQDIDDSGRMIKINIGIKGGKKMSVFIKPSVPLNIKINKIVYESKKSDIVEVFGDDYIKGSEGYWYPLKSFSYAIFIPCRELKASDNLESCTEYELLRNTFQNNTKINSISVIKKNASIIKQLIVWLWSVDKDTENVDEWFQIHTTEMTEKKLIDIVNSTPVRVDYRFPKDINTTEDGINYLENFIPLMFNLEKIHLYSELMTSMKQFIKNYQYSTQGYQKTANRSIINIFNGEKDFKKHVNTRIILGKSKYEQYYDGVKNTMLNIEKIPDTNSSKTSVFPYRSCYDNSYFLIQNNISDREGEAILGSYIWAKKKINLGYDLDRTQIWKKFIDYPFLMDLFGYTQQDVIDYSNEQTPLDTGDFKEALYFLAKNEIPVPDEKFPLGNLSVSVRYRNSDGFFDKLVDDTDDLVNIWIYGTGVYSSMLEIGKNVPG